MARARVNNVNLYYEITGDAQERIVLVHGSWVDHEHWDLVVPALAESSRVLVYDRRGHSQSELPGAGRSLDGDIDDLVALIEHLDFAPAVLVGNSYGAIVSLGLAARRPDLIRSLSVHEPPAFGLLAGDSIPGLEGAKREARAVMELIRQGDAAVAAERFVELAIGPGSWAYLPPPVQQVFIDNASTFPDENEEAFGFALDREALSRFTKPALVTHGELSPPWFQAVSPRIKEAIPGAEVYAFPGGGHVPQFTHPHEFVQMILVFARQPALR